MPGIVTLSIELELGWGRHDQGFFSHLSPDRTAEDRVLTRLLEVCDAVDVPITFDVVGHLLHEDCPGSHSGAYPNGWWHHDPGTTADAAPLFYAPDMIREIRKRDVDHEICTHTYSHVLADEVPGSLLELELDRACQLHADHGLPRPESIVMPRHRDVDYDLLARHGFRTIRRPIADYGSPDGSLLSTVWWTFAREHPPCKIRKRDGIVETTCTGHPSLTATALPAGREPPPRHYRLLPRRAREALHRRYLRGAIDRASIDGEHVHLWTHLYNLSSPSQWRTVKPALERLAQVRDRGEVRIMPMRDLPGVVS